MNHEHIESRMRALVSQERLVCVEVLHLISEAEACKHALAQGFADTYDWLEQEHRFSHAAANRRIQASRFLRVVPEAAAKLEKGGVSLTSLSMLQSALRRQERRTELEFSVEEKREWLNKIDGLNGEQTAELIACEFPEIATRKASVRPINAAEAKVVLILLKESVRHLERCREYLSHVLPASNLADVVAYLAADFVKRKQPKAQARRSKPKPPPPAGRRVKISKELRSQVFREAGEKCEFKDERSGRVCGSQWQLEIDHWVPLALGGSNERSNLRCLCRNHNQLARERAFGSKKNSGGPRKEPSS